MFNNTVQPLKCSELGSFLPFVLFFLPQDVKNMNNPDIQSISSIVINAIFYLAILIYLFFGLAQISNTFMSSIEFITSKTVIRGNKQVKM
jgi:hypothetical protein